MRSNRNYDQITYEKLLDELFKDAENEIEDIADLDRRAHKLSVKKELERLQHLQLIQEQDIRIRQLQDSYDMVISSKWWKLTKPVRKLYEKMQNKKGQKTLSEALAEIQNPERYDRVDYGAQREQLWHTCLREFADGEKSATNVLTTEYKEGDIFDVKVSVIIPTYNAGADFRELLATVKGQKGIREIEVVVVDSGSTDQTIPECEFAGVKYICIKKEEFSHSYARNLGADHATGDYLLFMTQDALPTDSGWLYRLLSVLISGKAVAVSPIEIDNGKGDLKYRTDTWNHAKYLGLERGDRLTCYSKDLSAHDLRRNAQLTDVTNLIPKDIFMKYRFEGDYAEDLRLGLSLIQDGYYLAQLTSVKVRHAHNRSPEYIKKRTYMDRKALCELFPDLKQEALTKKVLLDSIRRGEEQMKCVLSYMDDAKKVMNNLVVYGRTLEHAVKRVKEEQDAVVFLDWVMIYIRNSLIPYVSDCTAFVTESLHDEIKDAVYKAYQFEVGTRIADFEVQYGPDEEVLQYIGNESV